MIGKRLAHYEIVELIGRGGMGEVYRARDTRLDRDVAIKVLPEHRFDDAEARSRFEREAKAVAALSHPNILAIHDFGAHEGAVYAVTEFLEGKTLQERLLSGPIPLREALDFGGQVADGLAAAHEKNIVHRDIKPANLFLTSDGRLKILDFGLAKIQVLQQDFTEAATLADSTAPGVVLGTVRYMSPEQVRGEEVDGRSDIFSLATVLWQMLKGRVPFDGDSAVQTMNAILQEDPSETQAETTPLPEAVDRILRRCLEKAPERRFQSAQDLAFAFRNASDPSARAISGTPTRPGAERGRRLGTAVALVLLGALLGAYATSRLAQSTVHEPVKIVPLTHSGLDSAPSASPDGKLIAFTSIRDGHSRVWLRQLKGGIEAPLTQGTDSNPRFSPDGTSVLFLREDGSVRSAYRISVVGGSERKMIENVTDACWSPAGDQLAFVRSVGGVGEPVSQVAIHDIQSGDMRELTRLEDRFLYGLQWAPDGRWLSASTSSSVQNTTENSLILIDTTSGETRRALSKPMKLSAATWTPNGGSLVVAESMSLLGDISSSLGRVLLVDPLSQHERPLFWVQSVWAGAADFVRFDFLGEGTVVFDEILWSATLIEAALAPNTDVKRQLTQGNSRDRQPAYSPDGERIVFSSNRSGNLDIWTMNVHSGELRQITDDSSEDWDPAFSPNGQSILWSSNRSGNLEIWMADADGSNARQLSQDGVDAENPTQTPDGGWIVYASANPSRNGIWKLRADGSEEIHVAAGSFFLPEVSPDGDHVIFVANDPENDRCRMYVANLNTLEVVFSTDVPFLGFQLQIQPGRTRWMPDGQSFVFVGVNEEGRSALYVQDFRPGRDTTPSRRALTGLGLEDDLESFGISPDGKSVTVSRIHHVRSLKIAEGIPSP